MFLFLEILVVLIFVNNSVIKKCLFEHTDGEEQEFIALI